MGRNSVFGCKPSQIQSIAERAISGVADVFARAQTVRLTLDVKH